MKKIIHCLNDKLNNIIDSTEQVKQINRLLTQSLPAPLNQHCRASSFQSGILYLELDNPSLATEIRYLIPELRNHLRSNHRMYDLISIKASFNANKSPTKPKNKIKPVESGAKAANTIRQHLTGLDDPLSHALKQLASTLEQRNSSSSGD